MSEDDESYTAEKGHLHVCIHCKAEAQGQLKIKVAAAAGASLPCHNTLNTHAVRGYGVAMLLLHSRIRHSSCRPGANSVGHGSRQLSGLAGN